MKKKFLIISCLIIVITLSACNKDNNMMNNTAVTTPTQIPIQVSAQSPTNAPTLHDSITVTPVPYAVSISEVPDNNLDNLIKDNPIEKDNNIENSEDASQQADEETHLEFYDEFDEYNSSQEDYKGFILSEVWIDGEAYYQFLNKTKDIKIVVDQTQENAIIYHGGKSMDYDMGYLFDYAHLSSKIELCDVTDDEEEELIIYHSYVGFGTYETYCDVINISSMAQYNMEQYFSQLYSKITVEPIKFTEDDSVVCRITDINGNVSYGIAMGYGSTNLSDYSFEASANTSCSVYANHEKKCLRVSINIGMDDMGLICSLGGISSDLILNTNTNCFELSDDFEVSLDNIYTDEILEDSEDTAKKERENSHLEYYDDFEMYNTDWDYFKGFILSEVWVEGEPYYQLYNTDKDIKIVVDKDQKNAVIYHDGKSMNYYMDFLITTTSTYAAIELCDITSDGEEELIIYHYYTGTGFLSTACNIINLTSMTQYKIADYESELSSKITVEPVKFNEYNAAICRITDINGNVSYGITPECEYTNLNDFSFDPSEYCYIGTNNEKKCLDVNIGICMDAMCLSYLGDINSYLIFNAETNSFVLSKEFYLDIYDETGW